MTPHNHLFLSELLLPSIIVCLCLIYFYFSLLSSDLRLGSFKRPTQVLGHCYTSLMASLPPSEIQYEEAHIHQNQQAAADHSARNVYTKHKIHIDASHDSGQDIVLHNWTPDQQKVGANIV